MTEPTRIAVIYYSATGTVHQLATAITAGAEEAGADVRLRKVGELAPDHAIASNPRWAEHHEATGDVVEATGEDVLWADGVVFGSPTRYGNVSSQLKQFLDTLGGLWSQGLLADKVYSGFTASAATHGGQESTLLALYNTIHHFGGIVVAPGFTDAAKYADGNPYGSSHVSGNGEFPVDDVAREGAAFQGRRVVRVASALNVGRAAAMTG